MGNPVQTTRPLKKKQMTAVKAVLLLAALVVIVLEISGHDVFAGGYRFVNKFRMWNGHVLSAGDGYSFTNIGETIFLYRTPLPNEETHDAMILEIWDPKISADITTPQALDYVRADTGCPPGKACHTVYVPRQTSQNYWACREMRWRKANGSAVTSGLCLAPYLHWKAGYRYSDRVGQDSAEVIHMLEKLLPS